MLTILVVGGGGYIGSHMVWLLGQKNVKIISIDDLSNGHQDAVLYGDFILGDIGDSDLLNKIFQNHQIDFVIHFGSFIQVGESTLDPEKYYKNNVGNSIVLLEAMRKNGVNQIIFSSTAAIFGNPQYIPIDEDHPKFPINPYGRTKLVVEEILDDYDKAYGIKSICLRYFNACGCHPEALIGERHWPETHLIPLVLQAASGRRDAIQIYGIDYDTPDGTCVRDYIHVLDLAEAHWLALQQLQSNNMSARYNLGNGSGYSVKQIIQMVRDVTNQVFLVKEMPRRAGDPAYLVADSKKAQFELNWTPKYGDLHEIITHAWKWECQQVANHQGRFAWAGLYSAQTSDR